jgi:preprotein translocase subunit SecG
MDLASNRIFRNLLKVAAIVAAVVVTWYLLTFLFAVEMRGGRLLGDSIAMPFLLLTAFFMIVLVLIQRGKGGGLAGAFGGLGGQSAFGTKAGDLFTRVTIGVALFWIILCMATVSILGTTREKVGENIGGGNPIGQRRSSLPSEKESGAGSRQTPPGDTAPAGNQDGGS